MFQFIKPGMNFDFVGKFKIAFGLSIGLIIIGLISLIAHNGPRFGIDFAGGTLVQIKFKSSVKIDDIKVSLKKIGLEELSIQQVGLDQDNEYIIRADKIVTNNDKFSSDLENNLKEICKSGLEIRSIETVGPQIGSDLREKALLAIFYSTLFISIYISGRFEFEWGKSLIIAGVIMGIVYFFSTFNVPTLYLTIVALIVTLIMFWIFKLRYAMGAVVSLIHDVLITVGIMSLLDKEFTLTVLAALLTITGYSLNDTIIVFDRIRENVKKSSKTPLRQILNNSVNETLSRTILTSVTTLISVLTMFFLGGRVLHDFAVAMIVGIVAGTYSSIYVASPILLAWQKFDKKTLKPKAKK